MDCIHCETEIPRGKYCSNKCQRAYENNQLVLEWLDGKRQPLRANGQFTFWAKAYLTEIHGECCSQCGWCERHPNGSIPIEVDHIDGDWKNNLLSNLRLLCPNCHSLTPTYKNHKRPL